MLSGTITVVAVRWNEFVNVAFVIAVPLLFIVRFSRRAA